MKGHAEPYPTSWDKYFGQADAKEVLRCAAESAFMRGEPMDHVLIGCPDGGVGKTALAHLVAVQLRSKLFKIAEAMDTNKFRILLEQMNDFDVLFIDELHRFAKVTWLHLLLQDGMYTLASGQLDAGPAITVIGATTDPYALDDTLRGRFQYFPNLKPYTDVEAMQIAESMAEHIFADIKPPEMPCFQHVAQASNNNPRAIKQLLRTLRDLAVTGKTEWEDGYGWSLDAALSIRGVRWDGLNDLAIKYLMVLRDSGGRAGLDTIRTRLNQKSALPEIERLLLNRALITQELTGRVISRAGRQRLAEEEVAA